MKFSWAFVLLLAIGFANSSFCKDNSDNLSSEIEQRVESLVKKAELVRSQNPDSALQLYLSALELAREEYEPLLLAELLYNVSDVQFERRMFKESWALADEAFELYSKAGDKEGIANCIITRGSIRFYEGKYNLSLEYFFEALKIFEDLNDQRGTARVFNSIGTVYNVLEKDSLGIEYLKDALRIFETLEDNRGIATVCTSLGNVYFSAGDFQNTLFYNRKALHIKELSNDLEGIAISLNNIGNVYFKQEDYDSTLLFYNRAFDIYTRLNDKLGISMMYYNLGFVYEMKEDFERAVSFYHMGIDTAEAYMFPYKALYCYEGLAEVYNTKGNLDSALSYFRQFQAHKDSLFNEESHKQIAELETKYESAKKDLEIETQQERIAKQRFLIIAFVVGFIVVLIFTVLLFKLLRDKRKANQMLILRNEEILQHQEEILTQKEEIESQRDEIERQKEEIEAQRDLATEQRDCIMQINRELTDSIQYAKRIQTALLPLKDVFAEIFTDYFILYRPRDIISGDFYWVKQKNNAVYFAVADCTGHGVPGALMSMLGLSYLDEIIIQHKFPLNSQVLNTLRNRIITTLHQESVLKGEDDSVKDGMDIALCSIDLNTGILYYAGANNPVYIISRENKIGDSDLLSCADGISLYEIRPDKMPVGIYHARNDESFSEKNEKLSKGDSVYLFTDGYADQFGGKSGRKMKSKAFRDLLLKNSELSMDQQKLALSSYLEDWMEKREQIDDITVLGLRI